MNMVEVELNACRSLCAGNTTKLTCNSDIKPFLRTSYDNRVLILSLTRAPVCCVATRSNDSDMEGAVTGRPIHFNCLACHECNADFDGRAPSSSIVFDHRLPDFSTHPTSSRHLLWLSCCVIALFVSL